VKLGLGGTVKGERRKKIKKRENGWNRNAAIKEKRQTEYVPVII